jgi:hypothetical protein
MPPRNKESRASNQEEQGIKKNQGMKSIEETGPSFDSFDSLSRSRSRRFRRCCWAAALGDKESHGKPDGRDQQAKQGIQGIKGIKLGGTRNQKNQGNEAHQETGRPPSFDSFHSLIL